MTNFERIKDMDINEMSHFLLVYAVKVLREMKGVGRLEAYFRAYANKGLIRKLLESEVDENDKS